MRFRLLFFTFIAIVFTVTLVPVFNEKGTQESLPHLDSVCLNHPQYCQLEKFYEQYKVLKAKGGWKQIKKGDILKTGMRNARVGQLRERLTATEDLFPYSAVALADSFDIHLRNAVESFQKRHGLSCDGVVDNVTLKELNVSVDERIRQIEKNMGRWKKMPVIKDEPYLLVNVADFHLEALYNDSLVLEMKVIVGQADRNTPTFNADLTYLDFNPYWHIPPGILKKDIYPKILEDTSFLSRMNIRVFERAKDRSRKREINRDSIDWKKVNRDSIPYLLVQDPAPQNPMGAIKFMFPNTYNVYMHDTPNKELFEKSRPMFSSGCIRLSNAKELALYLLKNNPGWNCEKIDSVINSDETVRVKLLKPMKIYIQYFTSWVDLEGRLNFREDVYKWDK